MTMTAGLSARRASVAPRKCGRARDLHLRVEHRSLLLQVLLHFLHRWSDRADRARELLTRNAELLLPVVHLVAFAGVDSGPILRAALGLVISHDLLLQLIATIKPRTFHPVNHPWRACSLL